jgi:uncharacterized Zn finger protein
MKKGFKCYKCNRICKEIIEGNIMKTVCPKCGTVYRSELNLKKKKEKKLKESETPFNGEEE